MSESLIIDLPRKKKIKSVLMDIVKNEFLEDRICLFLSGGADSTLVGLIADSLGKKVTAISYELDGVTNWDCIQAERISKFKGWDFHKVIVPSINPKKHFLKLIKEFGCKRKTELEVLYPTLFLLDYAKKLGFDKILTGFGCPLPSARNSLILCRNTPEAYWSKVSKQTYESTATQKVVEIANLMGVNIFQPLGDKRIVEILNGLSTAEVHKPYWKHYWKDLFYGDFLELGLLKRGSTPNLQKGGGVNKFFAQLLDDPEINYKNYKNGSDTQRVSHLVKLWGKEGNKVSKLNTGYNPYTLDKVKDESSKKLFTVITTFAGGGGSSTGYKLAGGNVLFANEFIPAAVDTYKSNYPETPVEKVDIRRISRKSKLIEIFEKYNIKFGEYDILDGSPPCSTFSTAGKGKKKIEQINVKYSDTTQDRVGMLIHDFVFIANCTRPKVVVMENVPNIKNSDVFKHALQRLRKTGYLVNYDVLVSSNFGVPQKRRRLFVIGVRQDVAERANIKSESDILNVFPKGASYEPTIKDAFKDLEINQIERKALLISTIKSSSYELIKTLPTSPCKSMVLSDIDPLWTSDFNLVRSSFNQPCPTLTQMGQQMGRGGVHHPSENRVFTIGELKRLSGLPDDFKLTGSFNQKAERVGRMVPPLMTRGLAKSIYENILR